MLSRPCTHIYNRTNKQLYGHFIFNNRRQIIFQKKKEKKRNRRQIRSWVALGNCFWVWPNCWAVVSNFLLIFWQFWSFPQNIPSIIFFIQSHLGARLEYSVAIKLYNEITLIILYAESYFFPILMHNKLFKVCILYLFLPL